jgi:hypothetical protein
MEHDIGAEATYLGTAAQNPEKEKKRKFRPLSYTY